MAAKKKAKASVPAKKKTAAVAAVTAQADIIQFGKAWEYSESIESAAIVKIAPKYNLFINGKFVAPKSGKYFPTINPATEQKIADVAEAGEADVDLAVKAARQAYNKVWSKMPGKERAKYIYRIARLIQDRARELAVLESIDGGKPIRESRDVDVPLAAAHFFYYAGWADKLDYAFPGRTLKPLGVAGQVIPWNFPLLMAAWKLAPALACGNTVVLKPAETTPLTSLFLAQILQEAELPDGVVNIVTGAGATGASVVSHSDVNKVAFTGSTLVGKKIQQALAGSGKKMTLELGGKSGQYYLRRCGDRSGSRRHRQRYLFQSGPCVLRRFAPARARIHSRRCGEKTLSSPADSARGKSS